jgi:hypothetical protein
MPNTDNGVAHLPVIPPLPEQVQEVVHVEGAVGEESLPGGVVVLLKPVLPNLLQHVDTGLQPAALQVRQRCPLHLIQEDELVDQVL